MVVAVPVGVAGSVRGHSIAADIVRKEIIVPIGRPGGIVILQGNDVPILRIKPVQIRVGDEDVTDDLADGNASGMVTPLYS